jgi:hypothetical protein
MMLRRHRLRSERLNKRRGLENVHFELSFLVWPDVLEVWEIHVGYHIIDRK